MSIEHPKFMDESKRASLETAVSNLEDIYSADIEGLATVSSWRDGDVVKVRIDLKYELKPRLSDNISILEEDSEFILFEYKGFRYYVFHQKI